jgi:hypothetical protein
MSGIVTLATLDLRGCPIGYILDKRDLDQSLEKKYFAGWENGLTPPPWWNIPSDFRVVREKDGLEVLEHLGKSDRCLVTGENLWSDYTVEAIIRHMLPTSTPNADDEHCVIGRSGIMFRYQTLRHYYFYCLEGYERITLYRREDDSWFILGYQYISIDRSRYYELKVECVGDRFKCYLDGGLIFNVKDNIFKTGKVGIRTNTLARIRGVKVYTTYERYLRYKKVREEYENELAAIRRNYPQPILAMKIDLRDYSPLSIRIGNFKGEGRRDLLILHGDSMNTPRLMTMDIYGNVIWSMEYPELPGPASSWLVSLQDMNGDNKDEIICIAGDKLAIIDGATGRLKAEADTPEAGPYMDTSRGAILPFNRRMKLTAMEIQYPPLVCNLRGRPYPQDIIIKDQHGGSGGNTIWAYDDQLNPLWVTTIDQPKFGHHIDFYDIDRDGRDEIIAGYHMLSPDGEVMWVMEGAEYTEVFHGGRHVDAEVIGDLDGDPDTIEIAMAAGSEGFYLVDASTGRVRKHHKIGHAQGIWVGKFRPELPGFQILIGNRWGSYGILNLFSGDGDRLTYFEPDNVSQGGPPINWTGKGDELILLTSSRKALGMYDGYGRKVVVFPDDGILPEENYYFGRRIGVYVADLVGDAREEVAFLIDNVLYIYTQDKPYPKGERIYAPIRKPYPGISKPNWVTNID